MFFFLSFSIYSNISSLYCIIFVFLFLVLELELTSYVLRYFSSSFVFFLIMKKVSLNGPAWPKTHDLFFFFSLLSTGITGTQYDTWYFHFILTDKGLMLFYKSAMSLSHLKSNSFIFITSCIDLFPQLA